MHPVALAQGDAVLADPVDAWGGRRTGPQGPTNAAYLSGLGWRADWPSDGRTPNALSALARHPELCVR